MAAKTKPKKKSAAQSAGKDKKVRAKNAKKPQGDRTSSFPIVGIGASAGGLKPLEHFFDKMPPDSGLGFVIVQHLDPTHESIMTSLIAQYTRMKVQQAQDGTEVLANHVYVKPPDKDMFISDQTLRLVQAERAPGTRLPIDFFFRSLAEDQREKAICIVLSGAGTDGTLGLKEIKGAGGMVMVQDPEEAEYDSMPSHAIRTGLADIVLPVEKMPPELMKYKEHPFLFAEEVETTPKEQEGAVQSILVSVKQTTGHDFSQYKQSTIHRRIARRMAVHQITEIEKYERYLRENPTEAKELFNDLLINVTNFFRDPDAFAALQKKVLIPLLKHKTKGTPVRVWVPGCGTGEEVYTIAILLRETMRELDTLFDFQFFGTDIFEQNIQLARAGLYPDNIASDISRERLKAYFERENGMYRIDRRIREMVIFAVHDLAKDPPFSRIDLISCRNLLIYMNPALQKTIFALFHHALEQGGYLFLGVSEGVGRQGSLFSPIDKKYKIFKREGVVSPLWLEELDIPLFKRPDRPHKPAPGIIEERRSTDIRTMAEQAFLNEYAPPGVLVNSSFDILYFHGDTGTYLSPPPGEPVLNILKMIRMDLRNKITQMLHEVERTKERTVERNVRLQRGDETITVDLTVAPVHGRDALYMVAFEQKAAQQQIPEKKKGRRPGGQEPKPDPRVAQLEEQLTYIKQELQATIEELETSNEELKSANEELQANNEELQSTNEELESSKEELQSTNEELETVNSELRNKNEELGRANDDIQNLLAATDIGTIFLDTDLRIYRFTPAAKTVFNLIDSDVGRFISHITSTLSYERFEQDAQEVLDTLIPKEIEIETTTGRSILVRVLPYRTGKNIIAGLVVTFTDISEIKRAEQAANEARLYFENIMNTVREPLLVLNKDLKVVSANKAFYTLFKVNAGETEGVYVYNLGNQQWNIPKLQELLERIIPENGVFEDYVVEHDFRAIGHRRMVLNARRLEPGIDQPQMILLAFEDVTNKN
jgi:two-component system CheB/CheR fusion protein